MSHYSGAWDYEADSAIRAAAKRDAESKAGFMNALQSEARAYAALLTKVEKSTGETREAVVDRAVAISRTFLPEIPHIKDNSYAAHAKRGLDFIIQVSPFLGKSKLG